MSFCTCPSYPGKDRPEQLARTQEILATFLNSINAPEFAYEYEYDPQRLGETERPPELGLFNWNLNDLAPRGAELQEPLEDQKQTLLETVPFRNSRAKCNRSNRCCGMCVRQCTQRCIQDCLTRIFMWSRIPKDAQSLPIRMLLIAARAWSEELTRIARNDGSSVNTYDDVCATISWTVGDILSRKTNSEVRAYMEEEGLRPEDNPYKIDYAPQFEMELDPKTQKYRKKVNKRTGQYVLLQWPQSGMCPFCLPNVTIDRRYVK